MTDSAHVRSDISILVVEDDDMCREEIRYILAAAGFRVICARGFSEAIEFVDGDATLDIALVDMKLSAGTPHGVCFARMAQHRRAGLRVVFMSSSTDRKDFVLVGEDDEFLQKPFTPGDLLDLLAPERREVRPRL